MNNVCKGDGALLLDTGYLNSSVAVSPRAFPDRTNVADAKLLKILLCCFAEAEIPVRCIMHGACPRRRWDENGEIGHSNPADYGLQPDLIRICSSYLHPTLTCLRAAKAIVMVSDCTLKVDEQIRKETRNSLTSEEISFWSRQALFLTCRFIPWKYLDTR
jgi:hypothetical protein